MKKWDWGILGQDTTAVQVAEVLMKEHGTIHAVAGHYMGRVTAFAGAYTVGHCYDIKSLLAGEQMDIIYTAIPRTYYYDYMTCVLQHGKHVLCEKAIIVNHRQLQETMALTQKKQLILMGAMTIFHMPALARAKELVEQGTIGKLKMIQANLGDCKKYDVTNRFFSLQSVGGALLDISTYALSFVRWSLYAQPDAALTNMILFETGMDETSGAILHNSLDKTTTVTLTIRAKLPKVGTIAREGRYLEIRRYPRADDPQVCYTEDGWTETLDAGTRSDALICELWDMETAVSVAANNSILRLSNNVVALTDGVRRRWGMRCPLEDEEAQVSKKRCI